MDEASNILRAALIISAPVFEEFFHRVGVTRPTYLTSYDNDWICYYSRLLRREGIHLVWYLFSRDVNRLEVEVHHPTGSEVRFLPSPRLYNWWTVRLPYIRHFSLHLATCSQMLFRDLRDQRPDLLYVQDYESGRFDVVSFMGAALGIPVVGQYHGGHSPAHRPLRWLRRWALRRAAYLLSPNTEEHARLKTAYGLPEDRARWFPNPVPVFPMPAGQSAAVRESLGIPQTHRYVMFLGRLVNHHKGVDLLVSAFRGLAGRFPDLHLVIVGTGQDEKLLHEQARSVPRVHFLGWVSSRQRVQELLGASEVVACPSHEDAFPYTVAEAMTAGRPLVASAVGGLRDLVADGESGYLVPPGDTGALERTLEMILRDPARAEAMGQSGRARIEREFADSVLVPRLARMLRAAVSRNPSGRARAVAGARA